MLEPKHRGAASELRASIWLMDNGYEVFRAVSQHGLVDLVALKDGQVTLIDVKSATIRATGNSLRLTPSGYLSEAQRTMGVRLLLVMDDYVGFYEDHPLKQVTELAKTYYIAKNISEMGQNLTV